MIFLEGDYIYLYNRKKIKCMEKKEMTIKETRGTAGDYQVAYVNALKALDEDKELKPIYERMEREYQQALRDIAETVLGMTDEDFENNEVKSVENAEYQDER